MVSSRIFTIRKINFEVTPEMLATEIPVEYATDEIVTEMIERFLEMGLLELIDDQIYLPGQVPQNDLFVAPLPEAELLDDPDIFPIQDFKLSETPAPETPAPDHAHSEVA